MLKRFKKKKIINILKKSKETLFLFLYLLLILILKVKKIYLNLYILNKKNNFFQKFYINYYKIYFNNRY